VMVSASMFLEMVFSLYVFIEVCFINN